MTTPIIVRSGHELLYSTLLAAAWRSHPWLSDQSWSLHKDPEVWEKVRRDAVIEHAISQRLHSVASRSWRITAGADDPASEELAELVETVIDEIEGYTNAQYQLSQAILTARSYGYIEGRREPYAWGGTVIDLWCPKSICHVDRRRIRFNPMQRRAADGSTLPPKAVPEIGSYDYGVWKALNVNQWRNFIKVTYDDEEGRLGYGRGILDAIYFYHYAKGIVLREGLAGVERWAQGLKVAKIDTDREASTGKTSEQIQTEWLNVLEKTMARNSLVIDKRDDLQVVWPSGSGHQLVMDFLKYLDTGTTQLILGSVLPTGGGSGGGSYARATVEDDASERLIVYDRKILDECVTRDLIGQFLRLNQAQLISMGLGGAKKPRLSSVHDRKQDPQQAATIAETLLRIPGMTLRADEVYEKTGYTKPKPGEEILEGVPQGAPGIPSGFGDMSGGFGDEPTQEETGEPMQPIGGPESESVAQARLRARSGGVLRRMGDTSETLARRRSSVERTASQRLARKERVTIDG